LQVSRHRKPARSRLRGGMLQTELNVINSAGIFEVYAEELTFQG
jgi:hypothetical protein